jgi:hypothetical protein
LLLDPNVLYLDKKFIPSFVNFHIFQHLEEKPNVFFCILTKMLFMLFTKSYNVFFCILDPGIIKWDPDPSLSQGCSGSRGMTPRKRSKVPPPPFHCPGPQSGFDDRVVAHVEVGGPRTPLPTFWRGGPPSRSSKPALH